MGTLTAACPRLDVHCPHKLATSCRLTSTPNCCACADERPHSQTYSVYIDGVGFVQRGTRWQAYCWFCKEFWTNRLAATEPPLETSQTRIPSIPDQTEFLDRWFEFHQGYRIAHLADGSEHRMSVIGEPFGEVSPGFLPRTLDQLREQRPNDATRPENRFTRRRMSSEGEQSQQPQESLDDALDDLLQAASDEEQSPTVILADMEETERTRLRVTEQQDIIRFTARTQQARERFARVFGTREDVERDDYESPLSTMYSRAWHRHEQAEERRATGETEAPPLSTLPTNERQDIEQQILWGVLRESAQQDIEHVSDSATEVEGRLQSFQDRMQQLDSIFNQDSSETAAEERLRSLQHRIQALEGIRNEINSRPTEIDNVSQTQPSTQATTPSASTRPASLHALLRQWDNASATSARSLLDTERRLAEIQQTLSSLQHRSRSPHRNLNMDQQQDRPAPMEESEMTRNLTCKVCYSQLADIAVLPCGHMAMCLWCADLQMPVKHSHIPVKKSKCPVCRANVTSRYKIRF